MRLARPLAALACLATLQLALASVAAAQAVDPATAQRLDDAWPEIIVAADLAGVEPELLAGLLVAETGFAVLDTHDGFVGYGRMQFKWWPAWLTGEGLRRDDLDDPWLGVLAVGRALLTQRIAWNLATDAQLWAVWGSGPDGRFWTTSVEGHAVRAAAREVAAWRSAGLIDAAGQWASGPAVAVAEGDR